MNLFFMGLVFDLFIVCQILRQLCIKTNFQRWLRGGSYTYVFIDIDFLFFLGEIPLPDFAPVKKLMEMLENLC